MARNQTQQTTPTTTNANGTQAPKKPRVARASRVITTHKQFVAATKQITKWQGFIDEQNAQIQAYVTKQPEAANFVKAEIERLQKLVAQFAPSAQQ